MRSKTMVNQYFPRFQQVTSVRSCCYNGRSNYFAIGCTTAIRGETLKGILQLIYKVRQKQGWCRDSSLDLHQHKVDSSANNSFIKTLHKHSMSSSMNSLGWQYVRGGSRKGGDHGGYFAKGIPWIYLENGAINKVPLRVNVFKSAV